MQKLLEWDAKWTYRLRVAEQGSILHKIGAFFAHSGDSWFCYLALVIIWVFGTEYWKELTLILGISILITALVVLAVKFTVRRRRPEGDWGGIYRKTDPHSFPSGHAARAALLAVLGIGLGPTWFGVALMIWAPLVIVARVLMGVHYLLDVLAGAVLGILIGVLILQLIPQLAFLF